MHVYLPLLARNRSASYDSGFERNRCQRLIPWILAAWCGVLFVQGLAPGPLWRNEGLRATLAQEMLTSGDWIVPRLYGQPIFTKPPGMYWLIAFCSWPFGAVTEITARLPSVLAGAGLVLLFFWFFRRRLETGAGLAAALILPMSPMWLERVPSAEIDLVQTFWVAASILFFLRGLESRGVNRWWLLAYVCLAGGALTKWTGPAFFYATIVPLLWWRGELRVLFTWRHLLGAAVAAGVCCAWILAAVSQESWSSWYNTVFQEASQRLTPGQRDYPWLESLTHPLRIFVATLPWSPLALLTLRSGFHRRQDERGRCLLQVFHCWTWPNLLFWSLASEHNLRHSLPLIPGIAGLAILAWLDWFRQDDVRPRLRAKRLLATVLIVWLIVVTLFAQVVKPMRSNRHRPRETAAWLAGRIPSNVILYLFRLKDETLMFYYGRIVVRLPDVVELPISDKPIYAILTQREWEAWEVRESMTLVEGLHDSQGDPIVLVRIVAKPR